MTQGKPSRRLVRQSLGWIVAVLGFFHSLYYVFGMLSGWDIDGWNILQAVAGLVAVMAGLLAVKLGSRRLSKRAKTWSAIAIVGVCLFLLSFAVVEGMIVAAALQADGGRQADYILVLGARVRGEQLSLTLQNRLDTACDYALRYPQALIVLTGGQGPGEHVSEAEAMKRYLLQRGIPAHRLISEDRSTNTIENFRFSKALLAERTDLTGKTFLVVTSDFHMYRSLMLAKRSGLHAIGLAAPTPWFTVPKSYVREYAAVVISYLVDK